MNSILEWCLSEPNEALAIETADEWGYLWRQLVAEWASPIKMAIVGGFKADRLAWAFASGYQAALRSIVQQADTTEILALCVTEESSNRPSDIRTKWREGADGRIVINGVKSWVPLGRICTSFLVVCAKHGTDESARPTLHVIRLSSGTPGVSMDAIPPGRLVPELERGRLQMLDVQTATSSVLDGDGWTSFVKPFRNLEDMYVAAAVLAYLLREGRLREWPSNYIQRVIATLSLLYDLAQDWHDTPMTRVALAGAIDLAHQLIEQSDDLWCVCKPDAATARWARDKGLLSLASVVRGMRTAKA
ncbi:acyl-CoA dehydrogenase family protein [Telluria mixta]|uniref:Acyl-CoA dehydrogenase family protein n=1 Tax=Telluria mixta TaxID=34071 RepID=A0ABT2BSH2_9BURK|nr:acyl-CoA dehydrogenase family protein [Telluria mixta]MCS0627932.1 acyl-CoA dehydrogenase family protein [Telluria mixta]WEM93949.1 acyl-CoA dehydrogenase family protein [Telluria mixta]